MFPLGIVNQGGTPAPSWNKVLEMKFNGNFADSTGRHSPVSYGAVISTAQSVEGGSSMYVDQNGRVFTDGYGGDNSDFNFSGKDFRIICHFKPTSIGAYGDYVWCKTSGGNLGLNLKLGRDWDGTTPIIYLWAMFNGIGLQVPDMLTRTGFVKVEISRIDGVWSMTIDDTTTVSGSDDCIWAGWDGGDGYKGFLIGGAANSDRYSGYIDNFIVYTK